MAPTKTRFTEVKEKLSSFCLFTIGEKVLCYHGSVLYEAKIIRSELKDKMVHYLVHYGGWSKNWDEWVPENRTLKYTEANLTKQKELMAQCKALWKAKKSKAKQAKKEAKNAETPSPGRKSDKETVAKKTEVKRTESVANVSASKPSEREKVTMERPAKRGSTVNTTPAIVPPPPPSPVPVPVPPTITTTSCTTTPVVEPPQIAEQKRKKTKLLPTNETPQPMEEVTPKREVVVKLTDGLKKVLVDDQDLILRQKQLLVLPAHTTIDNIISVYLEYEQSLNPSNMKLGSKEEVLKGIKDYFNVTLGSQLLYKFERPQYSEILSSNKDKPLSSLYGAHHLLRLFVKLGLLLSYTNINEKSFDMILPHIDKFIAYMESNLTTMFTLEAYEVATPEYYRRCLST